MKEKLWTLPYIGMSASSFFQYMIHYTLLAALPVFAIQELQQSDHEAGLTLTFFQIGAVLFRPFAGRWIDEWSKRKVVFVTLALSCLVCFLYGFAQGAFFLLLLRFIHGAAFSTGTTATATMAALFSPLSRKGEGIGYFSVFTSLAMVVGPFVGLAVIHSYSFTILFSVCFILSLCAFVGGNGVSFKTMNLQRAVTSRRNFNWRNFVEPKALPVALTGVLLAFVYSSLLTFLPLYARSLGMLEAASYFFAVYAAVIVISRPFIGKAFDRFGAKFIVYGAVVVYCSGFLLLGFSNNLLQFLLSGAVIGLGFGGLNPTFQTLAILAAPPERSGLATATYFLSLDVGVGLGSFLLGIIVSYSNYHILYLFCAGCVVLLGFLYYFCCERNKAVKSESRFCENS
ncbi:MAG: MFS transporter [Sporomusaceae bacterium]|nr:MFS transporter [Sporomusaceae bacterium]